MSRETWALIKNNKNFNVHAYRRGVTVLIGSLFLSCLISVLMFYEYLNQPERDYYATSGVTSPIKLTAMLAQNDSPQALLEPDPPSDDVIRVIPQ